MVAPPATLSLRAYGRHRKARGLAGGNAVAVLRAMRTGRLVKSVVEIDGVKQIGDAALADAEWAANTDLSRAPDDVKARGAVTASVVTAARTRNGGARSFPGATLADASTREKNARADLAELDYQVKAGALVPAAVVEAAWTEVVTQIRAAVLSVPSKGKALMPHTTHADLAQWNELLCQALEGLAQPSSASGAAA